MTEHRKYKVKGEFAGRLAWAMSFDGVDVPWPSAPRKAREVSISQPWADHLLPSARASARQSHDGWCFCFPPAVPSVSAIVALSVSW